MISERDRKEERRIRIAEAVNEMNKNHQIIDSVAHIQKELKLGSTEPPKAHLIRSILRTDLGMKYKKIKPISWTANSHRNLILNFEIGQAVDHMV